MSPIRNSPGSYDDEMVIADGSERGLPQGVPLPLPLDLARKPAFTVRAPTRNSFAVPAGIQAINGATMASTCCMVRGSSKASVTAAAPPAFEPSGPALAPACVVLSSPA